MDYTEVPRSLLYKERTDLKDFGVQIPGTINNLLFSNLKELFMATDRVKELILRCFNNAYYICTLIPCQDFPETEVAEYEKLLMEGDPYDLEEVCAVSMAMVVKLLQACDARCRQEGNELIKNIHYRFTHYRWYHGGATESFLKMVEKHNTDGLVLPQSEFAPRDIIEVIDNISVRDLQIYAEYICERLAHLEDPRQRMYWADMAIAKIKDYQRELCEKSEYNPKKDCFKYVDNDPSLRDFKWEDQIRSCYEQSKEAIKYYTEHYPNGDNNHPEKQTESVVPISENATLVAENEQLRQQLTQRVQELNELRKQNEEINKEKAELSKQVKEKADEIEDLRKQLEEAHTIPDTVTGKQRVRMELLRKIMEAAGINKVVLEKWGNKDKAGTLMGTILDIKSTTCKTYISDPCLNVQYHEETIETINPLLKALGFEFSL